VRTADQSSATRDGRAPARSRRDFLRGVAAVAGTGILAGCGLLNRSDGEVDGHDLDAFLVATVALGDRYDVSMAAVPSLRDLLTPLRDTHRTHARVLAAAVGAPVPAASAGSGLAPATRAQALAGLAAAETSGRDEAIAACLSSSARLASLLGSIAAARATHLEVLT
jgi:hypothetical protein